MNSCPKCESRLVRHKNESGFFFECPNGHGRAIAMAVVRRLVKSHQLKHLWRKTLQDQSHAGPDCPICGQPMDEVPVPGEGSTIHLDVCRHCRFLWFDPHELESLPTKQPPKAADEKELSPEVREKMAIAHAELTGKLADERTFDQPHESWKWAMALLMGVPVEHEVQALRSWPWLTWTIAVGIVATSVIAMFNLQTAVEQYGLVPNEAFRYGGLTFLSSFFLHGGIAHLVGNTYFLLVFGDNVEDYLGRARYVLLLFLSTLCGGIVHVLGDRSSDVPCVGASGGISGIIVFYALQFPRARLSILWMYFWWFTFPASAALVFWLGLQLLLSYLQLSGSGSISGLAHLGGGAVGLAMWLIGRMSVRRAELELAAHGRHSGASAKGRRES